MSKKDEALKLALDALDEFCELGAIIRPLEVRDAIREALAEQPARKPWVELTAQEFQWIYDHGRTPAGMMELTEDKLREKNA